MALRVFQFAARIPANTPQDTPVTVPLDLDNWAIEQIDLEVPAGPGGLMGFAIFNNGVQWIPASVGQWLVWDDVQQSWPLQGQPNAGGWSVVGWNTGTYDHTVTVRMHCNPPTQPQPANMSSTIQFIQTAGTAASPVTL